MNSRKASESKSFLKVKGNVMSDRKENVNRGEKRGDEARDGEGEISSRE